MPAEDVANWIEKWHKDTAWQTLKKRLEIDSSTDVDTAIFAHKQWISQSIDAITNAATHSNQNLSDSNSCSFGRWFHGAGFFKYGHLEQYGKLKKCHEQMHLLAEELHNLSISRHREHALQRLDELNTLHDEFVAQLKSLLSKID